MCKLSFFFNTKNYIYLLAINISNSDIHVCEINAGVKSREHTPYFNLFILGFLDPNLSCTVCGVFLLICIIFSKQSMQINN